MKLRKGEIRERFLESGIDEAVEQSPKGSRESPITEEIQKQTGQDTSIGREMDWINYKGFSIFTLGDSMITLTAAQTEGSGLPLRDGDRQQKRVCLCNEKKSENAFT